MHETRSGRPFEVQGRLTFFSYVKQGRLSLESKGIHLSFFNETTNSTGTIRPGDWVRAQGFTDMADGDLLRMNCRLLERLIAGPPPQATDVSIDGLSDNLDRLVRFSGRLQAVVEDEIDPLYRYAVIEDAGTTTYVPFRRSFQSPFSQTNIGARIEIRGLCVPRTTGLRQHLGPTIELERPSDVRIISFPADRFGVPPLGDVRTLSPARLAALGIRRVCGNVLAVWSGNRLLVRTRDGHNVDVELIQNAVLPSIGTEVEVIGTPATDLYTIRLLQSEWRADPNAPESIPTPTHEIALRDLFVDRNGQPRYDLSFHGQHIRVTGVVKAIMSTPLAGREAYLEADGFPIRISANACPSALDALAPLAHISIAGTCILETDVWNPSAAFPQVHGLQLTVRSPDDVRILAPPPFWTTGRVWTALALTVLLLSGSAVWIRLLQTLVKRRERELRREIIAHVTSDLKVRERTRLAVELHDALSQNLSGVSLELSTASHLIDSRDELVHHLDIASKSLKACRSELHNCLWDLRSNAIDGCDMDEAIRRTLLPFAEKAEMRVRFNVPRTSVSDSTAYALLKIVRELAVNAIRHGKAATIRIAGELNGRTIRFSVRDDGLGFDPANAPGIADGHFGLQGIRERIKRFGGSFEIVSRPGKGTDIRASLPMPCDETESEDCT